jgi:hypothetical protein
MSIDEMIAILQAAKAGKKIQWFVNDNWEDLGEPPWNMFKDCSYRVKPTSEADEVGN